MVPDPDTAALAAQAGRTLLAAGLKAVTAESCTGGGVAAALTDVPGSSQWFERGYVTYSNAAKIADLGVEAATLERHGAVSAAVVQEMVAGALRVSVPMWRLPSAVSPGPMVARPRNRSDWSSWRPRAAGTVCTSCASISTAIGRRYGAPRSPPRSS